jgi:hypothetical protein
MAMIGKKKFSVKVNDLDKVEQLLQETYNLACQQYTQLQDEINKVANTTKLKDLDIEGKEKYGKIMSNYISLQQKSIGQKYDIAKLMAEIVKHNGNVDDAITNLKGSVTSIDLDKLRKLAKEASQAAVDKDETVVYHTNN